MTTEPRRDAISLFARHPVAANLLMLMMLIAGIFSLMRLNIQFFPNFELDYVNVRVIWRGASAEDVEESLTTRIEQELRTVDYVKKMTSTSSYGSSLVSLEFEEGTEMTKALDQVKDQVAQIRNLPTDSETPKVSLVTRYEPVARLLLTTDGELDELRTLAHQIEHELLDRGISRVEINGLPEEEIAIQVSSNTLKDIGMSLPQVAAQVEAQSQDLPAGEIGNDEVARQIRSLEQRREVKDFASLPLKADFQGRLLTVGDVAEIERRPMRNQVKIFYHGQPAVEIALQRTETANSLDAAKILDEWITDNQHNLPKGVELQVFDQSWKLIKERMNLLIKNGAGGLVLVLLILFIFLHGRVAFWVAVGIPVSFMATLFIMLLLGGSINMISMFALIMALGIIVDDAIVVGEDALAHYQMGERSLTAAEGGAKRMFAPVMSSSLTSIASFLPLMLIGGTMGNILFDIPFVVVCVIIASLIESFFILPGHLRHTFHKIHHEKPLPFRQYLDDKFNAFRDNVFRPIVTKAVEFRWVTITSVLALLIVSLAIVATGRLSFTFFPSPESTSVLLNARFMAGTPEKQVEQFVHHLNQTLEQTTQVFDEKVLEFAVTRIGTASSAGQFASSGQKDERFGSMQLELVSPDQRNVRNQQFIDEWKKYIVLPAGIETFTLASRQTGPPGSDIDVVLSGADAHTLKQAAGELSEKLKTYPGVSALEDDMPYGQEQLIYRVKGLGEALGLTTNSVGRQLRAAFDGDLVQIFQDGDDEVEVRVMLPDSERNTVSTLESMLIFLPNGRSVPLSSVVEFESRRGFDVLRHSEAQLAIHVTGRVNPAVNNNNEILDSLKEAFLPELSTRYGIKYGFEGRAEEQAETATDMKQGVIVAFILIYVVLAWVFGSYGWPLIVMMAIPCGLIGAFWGHVFMQIDLTILSLFGIFGLSGIVVNDSIILVTFFRQLRENGMETFEAIIEASTQRLRAVLLTSLTTIAGLTPLLFETSLQAQFLIPMATSISFGLMFATVLVLLVVPAGLAIYENLLSKSTRPETV